MHGLSIGQQRWLGSRNEVLGRKVFWELEKTKKEHDADFKFLKGSQAVQ